MGAYPNKEILKKDHLSGACYVTAMQGGKLEKIVISSPKLCGHQNRICVNCASQWATDYQILFDRTAGGRKLKKRLGEINDAS